MRNNGKTYSWRTIVTFLVGIVSSFSPVLSIAQQENKELSISVIAPPTDFEAHLTRALEETGDFHLSPVWVLPTEANFLVIFYDSLEGDLSHLPVALFRQFEGLARLGPAPMYFSTNISGPFSNVAFISWAELNHSLFGVSGNDRSTNISSCVAAYKVAQAILSESKSNSENMRHCSNSIN